MTTSRETADECLQQARYELHRDLVGLEEHIQVIKEILEDNKILYEDPTKFFVAIKSFREHLRSIDVPPELSFIANRSRRLNGNGNMTDGSSSGGGLLCEPGSVQRLENIIINSAYSSFHHG